MNTARPLVAGLAQLSWLARLNLLAVVAAAIALTVRLWPQWRENPDLSHGIFMPLVFVLLLHESRAAAAARPLPPNFTVRALFAALLAAALVALVAAGLFAAAVDWSHALVYFVLTGAAVAFFGAAVIAFAGPRERLVGFNWSALAGAGLWILCTPIPPGTYSRLTLALQLWLSEAVLQSLHLLGIGAIRQGNIIQLAHATVGVEEACSGVRSLISCVFAGIFFSATLVRRPWARLTIIALSAPLALLMNFARSLTLTLMANHGIEIRGAWHDATGFAVLGVTAAVLGGLAVLFERGATPARPPTAVAPPAKSSRMQAALASVTVLSALLVGFFVYSTRSAARRDEPAPDLRRVLPPASAGWHVTTADLYEFTGTLRTTHLAQRRYSRTASNGPVEITLYVAYWSPGQAPVSLVASHTPDACWPGAGWATVPVGERRSKLSAGDRMLPAAEHRVFKAGEHPQHVWFWHIYDGRPISYQDPYSPAELLRLALRFGFRREGSQFFVRVSSNRPWAEIGNEPLLTEFFGQTRSFGL